MHPAALLSVLNPRQSVMACQYCFYLNSHKLCEHMFQYMSCTEFHFPLGWDTCCTTSTLLDIELGLFIRIQLFSVFLILRKICRKTMLCSVTKSCTWGTLHQGCLEGGSFVICSCTCLGSFSGNQTVFLFTALIFPSIEADLAPFLLATVCVFWENWFGIFSRDIIWCTLLQSVTHSLSGLWVHRWGGYGWLQGLILTHVFSIHLVKGNSSATIDLFSHPIGNSRSINYSCCRCHLLSWRRYVLYTM
jgi:hypothetical protein